MASEAKLAANRQNALKSTGPKTPQGKVRSSANALTHGLAAKHFVAKGESVVEFERLSQNVFAQFPPRNELERHQVERLIELLWKLRRARLLETAALSFSAREDFLQINLSPESCERQQYIEHLPERYRGMPSLGHFFELAEKVDYYTERIWRQIYRLVDDLTANRILKMVNHEETPQSSI